MKRYWLLLALLLVPSTTSASSSAAWTAFQVEVGRRCVAESGLRQARSSQAVTFDDTLGKAVALVTGRLSLPKSRVVTVRKLCVFDQRSKRVWTTEVQGWAAPTR